jgi:hypothetical protein
VPGPVDGISNRCLRFRRLHGVCAHGMWRRLPGGQWHGLVAGGDLVSFGVLMRCAAGAVYFGLSDNCVVYLGFLADTGARRGPSA